MPFSWLTGKEQHGNRYDIQIQSYAAEPWARGSWT